MWQASITHIEKESAAVLRWKTSEEKQQAEREA
jgi:hypothetical protein